MRAFRDQNIIFCIGVAVCFLAFLLHVIGMSTNRWSFRTDPEFEYGLFRYCVGGSCSYYTTTNSDQEASQALSVLGAFFAGVALIVSVSHVILIMFRRYYEEVAAAAAVSAALSFVSIVLTAVVWAATSHEDLKEISSDYEVGWSLALSTVGGVLMAVSAVLFLVGRE